MSIQKMLGATGIMVLVCTGSANKAVAASALDSNLVTEYSAPNGTSIQWLECGSLPGVDGCFGSGTIPGLTKPCSITEGDERVVTNTPGQYITSTPVYVLDAGTTTGGKLTLDIYNETKNIQSSFVTTTFTLSSKLALPVVAGPTAVCSMSANRVALLAGTNLDSHAVNVTLKGLSVFQYGPNTPPTTVTGITQNVNGYITVQYGSGNDISFILVGPDGSVTEDGGGAAFLTNPRSAVSITSTGAGNSAIKVAHSSFHPTQE